MKQLRTILIYAICLFSYSAIAMMIVNAQPQWKFHIAYEDASGAKDTMWLIWDTTATLSGADTMLGEVSANMNLNEFNVWTYNNWLTWTDSIKTVANPYTHAFDQTIFAMNFQLPIQISWDTSLLHALYLPPQPVGWVNYARMDNDYFFMVNNHPYAHQFDMTVTNDVLVPDTNLINPWYWNPGIHFPVFLGLDQSPTLRIPFRNDKGKEKIHAYPNPFTTSTTIEYKLKEISNIQFTVYNVMGETVYHAEYSLMPQGSHTVTWSPSHLPEGLYYAVLRSEEGVSVVKMVKQ